MQEVTRGYDDTAYLKEMADGVISRRFSSVDEAARSMLGETSGSNVDRLRRKFRDQKWYERGLEAYVDAEIARRAEAHCVKEPEISAHTLPEQRDEMVRHRRGRIGTFLGYACAVCLAVGIAGLVFGKIASAKAAWQDPRDVAKLERAISFAESSFKGLYDLTFADVQKDISQAARYFLTPGAYTSYVEALNSEGTPAKVRQDMQVLRSKLVGEPRISGSPTVGYTVLFKVVQTTFTAQSGSNKCFDVRSFVVVNEAVGFGTSEFGLMGPPVVKTGSCSPA